MYRHKRERRREAKSGWSPLVFFSPGIFPSRFILLELPFLETTGKLDTEVVIHPPKVKRTDSAVNSCPGALITTLMLKVTLSYYLI